MKRTIAILILVVSLVTVWASAATVRPASAPVWRLQGQVIWANAPDGRIKARAYSSAHLSRHPVLVVWLHGDLPPGSGPYELAQQLASLSDNIVAAAVLRPGYTDAEGDTSSGRKGLTIGDNYTARVADDVHAVIEALKARFHPRAVVLMGHSGGAGVAADVLGLHPEDAAAAVLIACSCDPRGFMDRWVREHPGTPRRAPNPSLPPMDVVARVSRKTLVRMVIGTADTVVLMGPSQAYAAALKRHGVNIRLDVVPGADHVGVLGSDAVHKAVAEMIAAEGGKVHPPTK